MKTVITAIGACILLAACSCSSNVDNDVPQGNDQEQVSPTPTSGN